MKFLAALAPYLINHVFKYILTALGVSIITYVGFDALMSNLKNQFISSMGAVPAGAIQIFLYRRRRRCFEHYVWHDRLCRYF